MNPLAILLLALVLPAQAVPPKTSAPQQKCPIALDFWSQAAPNEVKISWKNNSEQTITAFKFVVQYTDSFGQPVVNIGYDGFEIEHQNIKPGKQHYDIFQSYAVQRHGWAAVKNVRFKDGSVWIDDGSLSCRVIDWFRLHGK